MVARCCGCPAIQVKRSDIRLQRLGYMTEPFRGHARGRRRRTMMPRPCPRLPSSVGFHVVRRYGRMTAIARNLPFPICAAIDAYAARTVIYLIWRIFAYFWHRLANSHGIGRIQEPDQCAPTHPTPLVLMTAAHVTMTLADITMAVQRSQLNRHFRSASAPARAAAYRS